VIGVFLADQQPGTHTHAFILRRYDTDAISLTTMFKVAFPGATEEEEAREMDWVGDSIESRLINRSRGRSIPPGPTVDETLMLSD
jgi:hypothetical protein